MANEDTRPVRMCDSCGGVDSHPRHVFALADGDGKTSDEVAAKALESAGQQHYMEILRQVRDDSLVMKHMDCCAEDGCPDGTCDALLGDAGDKRGDDLVAFLTSDLED